MDTIHAYRRLTHRYVGTWKHLDEHQYIGTVKLTPTREIRPADGMTDGTVYVRFGRLPAGMPQRQRAALASAVADSFTSVSCSCEHDCCGCASYRTEAIATGRRLMVRTTVTRNY